MIGSRRVYLSVSLSVQRRGSFPSPVLTMVSLYSNHHIYSLNPSGSSVRGQSHRLRFAAYHLSGASATIDQLIFPVDTVVYLRDRRAASRLTGTRISGWRQLPNSPSPRKLSRVHSLSEPMHTSRPPFGVLRTPHSLLDSPSFIVCSGYSVLFLVLFWFFLVFHVVPPYFVLTRALQYTLFRLLRVADSEANWRSNALPNYELLMELSGLCL